MKPPSPVPLRADGRANAWYQAQVAERRRRNEVARVMKKTPRVEDAARELGVSRATLYAWLQRWAAHDACDRDGGF
jgi:transcriptional regulator of acetoin/glycerol metabolism